MGIAALLGVGVDVADLPELDHGPVYERHLAEVDAAFADAIKELKHIRKTFARYPDADVGIDAIMPALGGKLLATDMAIGRFRATRDCKGAG